MYKQILPSNSFAASSDKW